MPVKLSKSGKSVIEVSTGKVVKRFKSRAKAKAYVFGRNLGVRRSQGKKTPRKKR